MQHISKAVSKYSEKFLLHCHFVRFESHTTLPGVEPESPRWETGI